MEPDSDSAGQHTGLDPPSLSIQPPTPVADTRESHQLPYADPAGPDNGTQNDPDLKDHEPLRSAFNGSSTSLNSDYQGSGYVYQQQQQQPQMQQQQQQQPPYNYAYSNYAPSIATGVSGFSGATSAGIGCGSVYGGPADIIDGAVQGAGPSYGNAEVLPSSNYHSPYCTPFSGVDDPHPVEQLVRRFGVWKMVIKQFIFYFKEMSIFKRQTYLGNKAMLENLEVLRRQNSGKLRVSASQSAANKLKKSFSSPNLNSMDDDYTSGPNAAADGAAGSGGLHGSRNGSSIDLSSGVGAGAGAGAGAGGAGGSAIPDSAVNSSTSLGRFIQRAFLPPGDHSVMSVSTSLLNYHSQLAERQLITYNQLVLKLIPRLENLKESLNEAIKQMCSIRNSSDFSTADLKTEIAKTGAVLSDYICAVELLTKGETKTSLGTDLNYKDHKVSAKDDPYLLRLHLDLQLKDQLFTEAHLKDAYVDLQRKAVQLENILFTETQQAMGTYSNLVNAELDSAKDNLVADLSDGFLRKPSSVEWDYFIANDRGRNLLPLTSKDSLSKSKQIRKKSDVIYPYQKDRISSCILSGFMEKKSKYLKNYSKFYYVLTCNFLHEFKSKDRRHDTTPQSSYSIDDMKVLPSNDDPCRFVIRVKTESSKSKYTFRCNSEEVANHWLDCLADLCSFSSPIERNEQLDAAMPMQRQPSAQSSIVDFSMQSSGDSVKSSNYQTLQNTGSSSSLHLPTFRRLKTSDDGSVPPAENIAAAVTMGQPIQGVVPSNNTGGSYSATTSPTQKSFAASRSAHGYGHGHARSSSSMRSFMSGKRGDSLSSMKSAGSDSPGSASGSVSGGASGGVARSVVSPSQRSTDEAEMGDYFTYVAPRPTVRRGRSSNNFASPINTPMYRSRSPSPARGVNGIGGSSISSQLAQLNLQDGGATGMDKRRQILELRLGRTPGAATGNQAMLNLPSGYVTPQLVTTPGVIPQSTMNQMFPSGNASPPNGVYSKPSGGGHNERISSQNSTKSG